MKTIHPYQKTDIQPDLCTEKNPFRGWYHIFKYCIDEEFPEEEWQWCLTDNETLVLLIFDLAAFKSCAIDDNAINNMKKACSFFIKNGKDIILRVTYDTEGFAMDKEPESIRLIKKHMRQVNGIVTEYKNNIFCVQGLFIGSWGEMHSSRYADEKSLNRLYSLWSRIIPKDVYMAVRTPDQWRSISGRRRQLGFYNDGILGSETDMGTYSEKRIVNDLFLQSMMSIKRPMGGEMLASENNPSIESVIKRFALMRITYLNSAYDPKVLDRLKNTEYEGISAYDYIGQRLGYSFFAEFKADKDMTSVEVNISNAGFGNFYFANEVYLVISSEGREDIRIKTRIDLRDCVSETVSSYIVRLKNVNHGILPGNCIFSLQAVCLKNGKELFFTYKR